MRIQNKLFTVFFIASVLLVGILVAFIQWSLDKGMLEYVNNQQLRKMQPLVNGLSQYYASNDSWQRLTDNHRRFRRLIEPHLEEAGFPPPPPEHRNRPRRKQNFQPPPRRDKENGRPPHRKNEGQRGERPPRREFDPDQREFKKRRPPPPRDGDKPPRIKLALLDKDKQLVVGRYHPELEYNLLPVLNEEIEVGFLAVSRQEDLAEGYELNFVEQQRNYFIAIAGLLLLLTLAVTLPLSRHFVAPIKQLAKAMSELAAGRFEQRWKTKRSDEFEALSRDFNTLAETLASNEHARKRWLADISHELRTPVAIMRGEIEAMIDGIRPMSQQQLNSSLEELAQLQRLIEDLHELTRADLGSLSYRKKVQDINPVIGHVSNKYVSMLATKGIELSLELSAENVQINLDDTRFKQLLSNLLNNVDKYAQNATKARLSSRIEGNDLVLLIEDNGPGVESEHLEKLFEPLYRVENSRNRRTGGSGLGLAICRQITEAHQGQISAQQSTLGGLAVKISLPIA